MILSLSLCISNIKRVSLNFSSSHFQINPIWFLRSYPRAPNHLPTRSTVSHLTESADLQRYFLCTDSTTRMEIRSFDSYRCIRSCLFMLPYFNPNGYSIEKREKCAYVPRRKKPRDRERKRNQRKEISNDNRCHLARFNTNIDD